MTPTYKIVANGKENVTKAIAAKFLSMTIHDEAGYANDSVEIVLEDTPPYVEWPEGGDLLDISIGYADMENQGMPVGLTKLGQFAVDEIPLNLCVPTVSLKCHAVDMGGTWKQSRTESYHKTTLGEMLETIVGRNGMKLAITPSLKELKLAHLDQTASSDSQLVDKLARTFGAISKVINKTLYFAEYGKLSGLIQTRPSVVTINKTDIVNDDASMLISYRSMYKSVKAKYYDVVLGEEKEVTSKDYQPVAGGEPVASHTLAPTYTSKIEAQAAADAKASALAQMVVTFDFTTNGNPLLMSETKVRIGTGFRPGIPKDWKIVSIDHTITRSGFTTRCSCEIPAPDISQGVDTAGSQSVANIA